MSQTAHSILNDFDVEDFDQPSDYTHGWIPNSFRQDGFPSVFEYDENGLDPEIHVFVEDWDNNIRNQQYPEFAENPEYVNTNL